MVEEGAPSLRNISAKKWYSTPIPYRSTPPYTNNDDFFLFTICPFQHTS